MTLRFRPHHFLCALGFRGEGYSDAFVANMSDLIPPMKGSPETEIEVVEAADAICAPCPKRRGTGCAIQSRVDRRDAIHGERLGVSAGDRLTWAEARRRIRDRVAPGDLATLCRGCPWLDWGYCEAALSELHAE